ncbi:MAG TPA: DUF5996 family protein [Candidatus Eremiobacteraceae bacterium]|nr:DUF5996 family protein [Candidatus Eremiobacteraceae bacterium]
MTVDDEKNNAAGPWHALDVSRWSATKQSLHLYSQMLGKIRLALSPPQPNWMFTPLYLTPRGLTTGSVPCRDASIEGLLDVFDSSISIFKSDGRSQKIPFLPVRTVAEVYADLSGALDKLDIPCSISPVPQEIPDTTPLHTDRRSRDYDPAAVQRWFQTCTAIAGIFDRWRSRFFGRSGVQLWWGAFDLALILFNGKRVAAPTDRGYIMKYDLDAELMNVGLYLGDEQNGPLFYGYIYPEPKGAEATTLEPKGSAWSGQLHEWVLAYDEVRRSKDPAAALTTFLDSIYLQCFKVAGWDRAALTYDLPKLHQS